MSSTALPPTEAAVADAAVVDPDFITGFDPAMRGRIAECDGGRHVAGTKFAGRQEFTGTLTGAYRDFGPWPWRWYLLSGLTRKPEGFMHEAVWCDTDSLTLTDAHAAAGHRQTELE